MDDRLWSEEGPPVGKCQDGLGDGISGGWKAVGTWCFELYTTQH
jgi:hypothetical protein